MLRPAHRATLAWLLALAVALPFCFAQLAETDLGWHLALGRLMEHAPILRRNALTWTFPDYPWYATSWLYDKASWQAWTSGGAVGVQALTFVFMAAALGLVAIACAPSSPWLSPLVAAWLLPRLTPRSFLASWLALAACSALCIAAQHRGWLWRAACVPVIALAANFHAGAVFSSALLAAYCVEALLRDRRYLREAAIATGGVAALLANPGGAYNAIYAASHLNLYGAVPITELQTSGPLELPAFYAVLAVAIAMALLRAREHPAGALVVAAFGLGGIWAARIAFDFYIAAAPVIAAGLPAFTRRFGARAGALLGALLVVAALAPNATRAARLHIAPRWDPGKMPVRAAAFIQSRDLRGRFYNSFADGGYLEFALPDRPAFQDARIQAFPPEFFAEQIAAGRSADAFDAWLSRRGVEWALIQPHDPQLSGAPLLEHARWALVHWDDQGALLVRRDVPALAGIVERDEYRHFHPLRVVPTRIADDVARLSEVELRRYLAEVTRFLEAMPEEPHAVLARCAVVTRLRLPDAPAACAQARGLPFRF